MTSSVLVTGGAGFIGSHVADELVKAGRRVIVLDDLSGGFRENVPDGATLVVGTINDNALVERLFEEHRFRDVFHLAAYAAEGLSHFIRRFNYENNLVGTVNLLNASVNSGVRCFVFTSSIAVYGENQLPMTEDLVPRPEDPYGIAKFAVELDLAAARRMWGMEYVIFRPHNVFGERQNIGDRYRNVVGIFMNQIMRGEPLTIFGDGTQTRAFSYIRDVAPHIARCVDLPEAWGETFNVGSDVPRTVTEVARAVMAAMGREVPIRYLEERKEVKHAYCSHEKFARVFGATSPASLEEGVGVMAQWAQRAGAKASAEFSNIEVTKNLPGGWVKR